MDIKTIDSWAEHLLDIGKGNNLINFKNSKASTVEILRPDIATLFNKAENGVTLEVYYPNDDEDFEVKKINAVTENDDTEKEDEETEKETSATVVTSAREKYIAAHEHKLKKPNRILIFNQSGKPLTALRNIQKKADMLIEETGVNVAYMAFGFVNWYEKENKNQVFSAPLLLVPIHIKRRSAIDPYHIRITEDEIIVNPTFNYKLAVEYKISLPEYSDQGFEEYLAYVTGIVKKIGWSVSAECKIGTFSFLKVNMYHDLKDNSEQILKNPNVRTLLGLPQLTDEQLSDEANQPISAPEPELVFKPEETEEPRLHNVVDADASQSEAIKMAKSGQSFVLQGPPGTGKSQTITNIIAEFLADGKTVLFVSEKLAALNVVYNKLKQAGLEDFCLELHSHKTGKTNVIKELCRTLRAERSTVSSRAENDLADEENARKLLEKYTNALHERHEIIDMSLYELFEMFATHRNIPDSDTVIPDIADKGEEYLKNCLDLIGQYVEFIPSIGNDYRKNPWYGYNGTDTSYQAKTACRNDLLSVADCTARLFETAREIEQRLGVPCDTIAALDCWKKIFRLAAETDTLTPELFDRKVLKYTLSYILDLRLLSEKIIALRNKIKENYFEDIFATDCYMNHEPLIKKYDRPVSRFMSKEYRHMIRELRAYKTDGKKVSYEEATTVLKKLKNYNELMETYASKEESIKRLLGKQYIGIDTDWKLINDHLTLFAQFLVPTVDPQPIAKLSVELFEKEKPYFKDAADTIESCVTGCRESLDRLAQSFDKKVFDFNNAPIDMVLATCEECLETFDTFENWCRFRALFTELEASGLVPFIHETIENNLAPEHMKPQYEKLFCRQWIDKILCNSVILGNFSRVTHDKVVNVFCDKDMLEFEINKAIIKALVSSKRPALDLVAQGSAVSMLLRENEKKRKQKGIRTLLSEAGDLIQLIKPCFLMSPLSVSTFLTSAASFDVVIFDEASQIFPQDAMGAIYRGKQLIVVGDSKQMPPSNFFTVSTYGDASDTDTETVADFESILDICSATFSQLRLKWHYRSRYEPLISFSNEHFYDGELVTFPSSVTDTEGIGVDYHFVSDGVFEHGTRVNRKEAEYVVDLIFKNAIEYPERSLGVVAFSIAQQELIDKLLMQRRRLDPSHEEFFDPDREEPFFIKNLETVQGDERDTVIFSIAYAKDQNGKLMHNFGPLNKVGGERRLNVAITRAKSNIQVVSSMHGSDISTERAGANGARLLKDYLEYAEFGQARVDTKPCESSPLNYNEVRQELEEEICEFLRANGFVAERKIGSSAFPVDIAVRSEETGDYVLALECDGLGYKSFGNVRDRDRLRKSVLERMGWKYHRIWSTDWFTNNSIEKEALLDAARNALSPLPRSDDAQDDVAARCNYIEKLHIEPFTFPVYEEANIPLIYKEHHDNFQSFVKAILEVEAPLSEEWLLKRISYLFNRAKVTSVVMQRYEELMIGCQFAGIIRDNGFLYLDGSEDTVLRTPNGTPREIKYISLKELASGMLEIIRKNITISKTGLYHAVVSLLGFARMSNAAYIRLDEALALIADDIDMEDDVITYTPCRKDDEDDI